MSEVRLRMRLVCGLVILWVGLLGYLLLGGEVLRVLSHWLESCTSRSRDLHNLYTRSFNTIGGLLFLL